ncbi:hypothetical protein MRB53_041607 [Persea americana]|nr:hypothetical protein MRB53_041607 [Persea americana]
MPTEHTQHARLISPVSRRWTSSTCSAVYSDASPPPRARLAGLPTDTNISAAVSNPALGAWLAKGADALDEWPGAVWGTSDDPDSPRRLVSQDCDGRRHGMTGGITIGGRFASCADQTVDISLSSERRQPQGRLVDQHSTIVTSTWQPRALRTKLHLAVCVSITSYVDSAPYPLPTELLPITSSRLVGSVQLGKAMFREIAMKSWPCANLLRGVGRQGHDVDVDVDTVSRSICGAVICQRRACALCKACMPWRISVCMARKGQQSVTTAASSSREMRKRSTIVVIPEA